MARFIAIQIRRAPQSAAQIEQMRAWSHQHLLLVPVLLWSAMVAVFATLVAADARPAHVSTTYMRDVAAAQHAADPAALTTPTPLPSAPLSVPAGWQVYRGHHFALAYPPGWVMVDTSSRHA